MDENPTTTTTTTPADIRKELETQVNNAIATIDRLREENDKEIRTPLCDILYTALTYSVDLAYTLGKTESEQPTA